MILKKKNVKQASTVQAHDTFGHLVLLDYRPRLTYNRAGFTYKSLRNYVQQYYVHTYIHLFDNKGPHRGCVRTLRTLYVYATDLGAYSAVS